MKKIVLLSAAAMSTVLLSGCGFLSNLFDSEKSYSYTEYKSMLADRNIEKAPYTKAVISFETIVDGSKNNPDSMSFTWDESLQRWYSKEGNSFENETLSNGNVIVDVRNMSSTNASTYQFFATKSSYRILYESDEKDSYFKAEWKYDKYGCVTQFYLKATNKETISTGEGTAKVKYSK